MDLVDRLKEGTRGSDVTKSDSFLDGVMMKAAEEITRLREENARMREALTPSAETKAAYIGEFQFQFGDFTPNVPWTTTKEIMRAILARAAKPSTNA